MNFKKIMAGVVAGSMVAAMSVSAFAADGDCSYIDGKTPSYTYTVQGDVSTITADVVYAEDQGDAFNFNDWCGNGVIVTLADGTKTYYQWGGKSVTWGWDIDDDKVEESEGGVNGDTWLGTVEDRKASLSIPVAQGATVEFYTLGWDSYDGVQYTVAISGDEAAVETPDDANPTGDVAPVAYLAAVVALAGAAVVASKKVRA